MKEEKGRQRRKVVYWNKRRRKRGDKRVEEKDSLERKVKRERKLRQRKREERLVRRKFCLKLKNIKGDRTRKKTEKMDRRDCKTRRRAVKLKTVK